MNKNFSINCFIGQFFNNKKDSVLTLWVNYFTIFYFSVLKILFQSCLFEIILIMYVFIINRYLYKLKKFTIF